MSIDAYNYDSASHTLHIVDQSALKDRAHVVDVPWYDYRDEIESVEIDEGVSYIGQFAFYKCSNLKVAKWKSELTRIGAYAFYDCIQLKEIWGDLPSKLGFKSFYNCPDTIKFRSNLVVKEPEVLKPKSVPMKSDPVRAAALPENIGDKVLTDAHGDCGDNLKWGIYDYPDVIFQYLYPQTGQGPAHLATEQDVQKDEETYTNKNLDRRIYIHSKSEIEIEDRRYQLNIQGTNSYKTTVSTIHDDSETADESEIP